VRCGCQTTKRDNSSIIFARDRGDLIPAAAADRRHCRTFILLLFKSKRRRRCASTREVYAYLYIHIIIIIIIIISPYLDCRQQCAIVVVIFIV